MERKFSVGDELVFKATAGFAAQKGAKAICKGYDKEYVTIHWIDLLSRGQMDGGYLEDDFELLVKKEKLIKQYGIAKFCKEHYVSKI